MGEEAPEKTLRELNEPDVHQRPIGSNGEDPHKHLRDFYWACDLLRPHRGEVPKVVSCGVCGLLGHHNDQCPEIKENIVDNPLPPFPSRLSQPRKEFKDDEELFEVFKKVEVNLPFLTEIKSIPSVEFDGDIESFNVFNDVENLATNGQHALDNDFSSSDKHDLGRNINNDDEHTLKGIDIENDLSTNLIEIASKLDDEKNF
ncbi:uncharacterized protein E5676_scaffold387G00160 [Cucumis melo var. makuwa]|uniref:Uncharacterized protein n=1 Tax=Cucumis melo var. makuwa TaxID=1194695 RepID=A0A5A7V4B2_CUCMM|nr:uncharacterized protein E6C27_scaffold4427G00150 [Cucumis melo var. makuwa]TYK22516.1 uncharacterized protein E5676_scaffold387G00160 [Cucumis melo var. makuwa]